MKSEFPKTGPCDVKIRQQTILQQTESEASAYAQVFDTSCLPVDSVATRNTENLIGSIQIPVGMAIIRMLFQGEDTSPIVPLATYEGALVASINRGAKALRLAGGAEVIVENYGMTRAPVFSCANQREAHAVADWIETHSDEIEAACTQKSAHTQYLSHTTYFRGTDVYVRFVFDTDEAMGMNMATIAADTISQIIVEEFPGVRMIGLSSNVCTDKKDAHINRILRRGYEVSVEATLTQDIVEQVLKTTPSQMVETHVAKNLVGSNIAGSFSQNAQVANVVAAIYLATGQDPAHVVEGSSADLTCKVVPDGLYVSLILHSILVGTVGGGTYLPAQSQARKLIGGGKEITSAYLAAVIGTTALAGEVSLLAALAQGVLSSSHERLAR